MNPKSLHALVIDRHFGELSQEASELLAHHLAHHPESREEAKRILQSLDATGEALQRHPELARVSAAPRTKTVAAWRSSVQPWMLRAAAVVLLAAAAAGAGFIAGRSAAPVEHAGAMLASVIPSDPAVNHPGPWARYRVSFDPASSGMKVVRVDVPKSESRILR